MASHASSASADVVENGLLAIPEAAVSVPDAVEAASAASPMSQPSSHCSPIASEPEATHNSAPASPSQHGSSRTTAPTTLPSSSNNSNATRDDQSDDGSKSDLAFQKKSYMPRRASLSRKPSFNGLKPSLVAGRRGSLSRSLTLPRNSASSTSLSEMAVPENVELDVTNHSMLGLLLDRTIHSSLGLDNDASNHSHSVGLDISSHNDSSMPDIESGLPRSQRPMNRRSLLRRSSSEMVGDHANDDGSIASSLGSRRTSFGKKMNYVGQSFRRRRRDTSETNLTTSTNKSFGTPSYDFLKKDESKDRGSIQGTAKWWHAVFAFSVVSLVVCVITLWAPYPIGARMPSEQVAATPWSDGCRGVNTCICPRETVCADDLVSMIFLTIARASAWFDYPLYMLLFLSKARNVNNFLQKTMLRCWINFSDFHKVHAVFGTIVGIESTSHCFFHLLRWARRKDDIRLLWTHPTGITGLISILVMPVIVLPMVVPYLKKRLSFEWRKGLHYLSIIWGACLMFHAPQRIFWLIGVPLLTYAADRIFGMLYKTHLIENAHFERLGGTSCIVTFENPPDFGKANSAYVYLMLPWLSKYQFHAFRIYPCKKQNHSQLCISKTGKCDWTGNLMEEITIPSHKPAFVVGPFLSPFSSSAMDSENFTVGRSRCLIFSYE